MARKCGRCRGEGHTRVKCPNASPEGRLISTAGEDLTEAYSPQEPTTDEPDPFESPTETESLSKGSWFTSGYDSECDTCDGAIFAGDEIRADGQGGWECRANCEHDETPHGDESPVTDHQHVYVWADDENGHSGSFSSCGQEEPEPTGELMHTWEAPVNDHRKWCSRCRLIGHYSADCKTPMLDGGQVSVPGPDVSIDRFGDPAYPEEPDPFESPYVTLLRAEVGDPGTVLDKLPDPFEDPTEPRPSVNVSGQPDARYEWYGKQNRGYLVKLPDTGDFRRYKNGKPKGLTRVTTFVKAASDSNALTDWAKRNVLIGASRRPDVVAKAHGLTHEDDKPELMNLVGELETAAGAKVSADVGTLIHELTERWDGGQLKSEDIPEAYKELLYLYDQTLKAAGLRPVPGLIERTTYISEYGGVVGTLDRVYLHEASGQYVVGDVKTGKTLKYGMDEIESQEWAYAHGVNEHGVYDWNTDRWYPATAQWGEGKVIPVSEEWGVIVHMPVQGDDAGRVMLVRADLQRGRRHADVCHTVREERANKPKPEPWTGTELSASQEDPDRPGYGAPWELMFSEAGSKEQLAELYTKVYGVLPEAEVMALVGIGRRRLAELAVPAPLVPPLSWRQQAERVLTKEDAAAVWQEASEAGVSETELNELVAIMTREIS